MKPDFTKLQSQAYHAVFTPAERERMVLVAEGRDDLRQPDDKFKMGERNHRLQWYGLRLGGQHFLDLLPSRNPDYRTAVGDILMTVLHVANILNLRLDQQELPSFDKTDFSTFASAFQEYVKGAEDLDHADPESYYNMRKGTVQLAGWLVSAAGHLQTPLETLLAETITRLPPLATKPEPPPAILPRLAAWLRSAITTLRSRATQPA